MNKEEQIKELVEIIRSKCADIDCNNCKCESQHYICELFYTAENIYNLGYHKTIWYKLEDKLPDTNRTVIIATKSGYVLVGQYNDFTREDGKSGFFWVDQYYDFVDDVVAWTELPAYNE